MVFDENLAATGDMSDSHDMYGLRDSFSHGAQNIESRLIKLEGYMWILCAVLDDRTLDPSEGSDSFEL